jgi:hypothetical protein
MKRIHKYSLLLAVMAALVFSSCKNDVVNPDGGTPSPGTFKAYLTDAPADYEALNIEILKVQAWHAAEENSGWVMLNNNARTVNILKFTNGLDMELTPLNNLEVPEGRYTKLRLTFGENNTLVLNPAASAALGILGGGSGVFDLNFAGSREVDVAIDEQVNKKQGAHVLVDFDATQSVYYDLNRFILRPSLSVVHNTTTGVRGHVNGAETATVTLSDGALSYTTFINASGDFTLRGMESSVYELTVTPGRSMEGNKDPEPKIFNGVVVVKGEFTSVGEINF